MKVLSFSPVVLYDNVKGINEITISNRIALLKRQTRGLIGYRREGISVELKFLRRVARKNFKVSGKFHSLYFKYNSLLL